MCGWGVVSLCAPIEDFWLFTCLSESPQHYQRRIIHSASWSKKPCMRVPQNPVLIVAVYLHIITFFFFLKSLVNSLQPTQLLKNVEYSARDLCNEQETQLFQLHYTMSQAFFGIKELNHRPPPPPPQMATLFETYPTQVVLN